MQVAMHVEVCVPVHKSGQQRWLVGHLRMGWQGKGQHGTWTREGPVSIIRYSQLPRSSSLLSTQMQHQALQYFPDATGAAVVDIACRVGANVVAERPSVRAHARPRDARFPNCGRVA